MELTTEQVLLIPQAARRLGDEFGGTFLNVATSGTARPMVVRPMSRFPGDDGADGHG